VTAKLKIKGEVKIRYDGGYIERHNNICAEFIYLVTKLLTSGVQRAQISNFSLPTSICITFLCGSYVVATIPATISYKEDGQYAQYITYRASRYFPGKITITCIGLVAVSNSTILYRIAIFPLSNIPTVPTATKLTTSFICVTWTIRVTNCSTDEQSVNNVAFTDRLIEEYNGSIIASTFKNNNVPVYYKDMVSCVHSNFIILPIPVSNFVVLLLLVPVSVIQQYNTTYLFQAYSSFAGADLSQLNGIPLIAVFQNNGTCVVSTSSPTGVDVPTQQLVCGGSGQNYQVVQPCVSQIQGQMVGCKLSITFQNSGTYTFATIVFYCIGGTYILYMVCTRTVSVSAGSSYMVYDLVEVDT